MKDLRPIRVIAADGHPLALEGLKILLSDQDDMEVIAIATDGIQLVETVKKHIGNVDVVVLNFDLPEANGQACLEYFRWQEWPIKVVVLANEHDDNAIRQALTFGIEALLDKYTPLDQIVTILRQVYGGQIVYPSSARRWMRPIESPLVMLSERELEVLALAAKGLPNTRISEQLVVSRNTVKTHLKNIYEKLGVTNRTEASMFYHRYKTVNH